MIKKFFTDTLDLILEALSRLGLLRGGAEWWKLRMRRRMGRMGVETENVRRSVRSEYRMCRMCRALVPAKERACGECGAPMTGIPRGGAGRLFALVLPSFGSASMTIVGLIVTIHLALTIASSQAGISFSIPTELLWKMGAKWTPAIVYAGEWWRLVNPILLHGSLMHIGFNAYALANLGPIIEQIVGRRRFLVVFFATGIFSFVVSAWYSQRVPSVGASGALFGLIGFGIVHGYVRGGSGQRYIADQLVRWALFGVLMIFLPMGIDHAAHAGGFAAGALFGWLVTGRAAVNSAVERLWTVAAVALCALPAVGFVIAIFKAATSQ